MCGFLRLPEVIKFSGLSKSTIERQIASGNFPGSIPISGRNVGWDELELCLWKFHCLETRKEKGWLPYELGIITKPTPISIYEVISLWNLSKNHHGSVDIDGLIKTIRYFERSTYFKEAA